MNDSATGGYLLPIDATPPEHDVGLDSALQQMVAGLTGLPAVSIRPRWQTTVPKQPEPSAHWCAMGVTNITSDANPALAHDGAGEGSHTLTRVETIAVLCSFYGPRAMQYAAQFRDGLYITQNHDLLHAHRMALIDAGDVLRAPEFVNQQWIKRYDMTLSLRRRIVRAYPILNLLSAPIDMKTDPQTDPHTED